MEILIGFTIGIAVMFIAGVLILLLGGRKDEVPTCKCKNNKDENKEYAVYHGLYLDD